MKVLVIGSGGREHALVWKLKQSKKVDTVFCAPGNGGISLDAKCINIKATNRKALADFAHRNKVHLTVVGPEQPLVEGIVDEFQRRKLRVFGPEKKAAELEGSKVFAKEFMQKYHIPTAPFKVFESAAEAIGFCKSVEYPVVIKADGLAAGKGVSVVHELTEAEAAIRSMIERKKFGKAGRRIVIESFVKGQEVSIMVVTDGKTYLPFLPSQDHKQAYDGDTGPNTGGMGAYCPAPFIDDERSREIREFILDPLFAGLRNENIAYRGVLYAGLIVTDHGAKVLEFNCRFGDPETQVVLPLLKTDLFELMLAVADRKLSRFNKLDWRPGVASCVVMASKGYPGKYKTGTPISGLRPDWDNGNMVFHAGTQRDGKKFTTAGGRVLGVMGVDNSLRKSLDRTYRLVKKIRFSGAAFRRDIGFRAIGATQTEGGPGA